MIKTYPKTTEWATGWQVVCDSCKQPSATVSHGEPGEAWVTEERLVKASVGFVQVNGKHYHEACKPSWVGYP